MWQTVGTDWLRRRNVNHWLLRAERALEQLTARTAAAAPLTPIPDPHDPQFVFQCAALAFYGLTPAQVFSPLASQRCDPLWGQSPADLVAFLQAEVRRHFPDFAARRQARPTPLPTPPRAGGQTLGTLIITDTRFENEAAFIRGAGGTIWHIDRAAAPRVRAHASEAGVSRQADDRIIDNNGSLNDLRAQVMRVARA